MKFTSFVLLSIAALAVFAAPVAAQFTDDFETAVASPTGVVMNGQNGWYLPPVANSIDGNAFTYAGNTVGIPAHPTGGGGNFASAQNTGGVFNVRMQHAVNYGTPPLTSGIHNYTFDICTKYNGTTFPAVNNIGSFSLQPSTTCRHFIMLATWAAPIPAAAAPTKWNADFVYFSFTAPATNTQIQASVAGNLPTCFTNLDTSVWYRWSTTWDWATNQILEISIQNLTTGVKAFNRPAAYYLRGGVGNAGLSTDPTDARMFVGGTTAGNVAAFDNINIGPGTAPTTVAEYQVNQPLLATFDINGATGTAFCPATVTASFGAGTIINLNMTAGGLFDVAYDIGPAYPASSPIAVTLPDGQIFGLNVFTASWLSGPFPGPTFTSPMTLSFGPLPPGLVATVQVVAFGVAGSYGLGLSQPVTVITVP